MPTVTAMFARPRGGWAAWLLAAALAAAAAPAQADPASEAALRALVAAIDQSPDWTATDKGIASDPASGATVLTGLRVESSQPGMTITVDKLSVIGARAGADGRYAATRLTAGNLTLVAGPIAIALADVSLDDFAALPGLAFRFDPAAPFSSLMQAYGALAKTKAARGQVGTLGMLETLAGITSRVLYKGLTLEKMDGGRIASLAAGPLTSESPIATQQAPSAQPLVTMTVARAEAKDLDFGAVLAVYDPQQAVGPGAPRPWQRALASVSYRDVAIGVPGVRLTVGAVGLEELRVRPSERPFVAALDRGLVHPFADDGGADGSNPFLQLMSSFAVGHFSAAPVDVEATGIDQIHLDAMTISNLSLDGLGELALTGIASGVEGVASVKAARLAIGAMTFPKQEAVAAAIEAGRNGGDVDFSSVMPGVGVADIAGIDVNIAGLPPARLGKLRVDLGNRVGIVPTSVKVDLAGVDVAGALLPMDQARQLMAAYGYDRVQLDLAGRLEWDEGRKTTNLSDLRLAVKDVGTLTGEARLTGPPREAIAAIDSMATLQKAGDAAAFAGGAFTFKDESVVKRALDGQASRAKVDPEKFRDQFARGLPFMLAFIGNRDFLAKATPVLQDFIRAPGTVTVSAAPPKPVTLSALVAAARGQPFSLPGLLGLSLTGTPGPKPPAPPQPQTPAPGPSP